MQEHFKFRHVHAITGTFVLVVLGVLIAALVFAGRSQRWFIGNANLRIVLPEEGAAGIRQGSEVYFLGTLVGTVSDVSVDRSGRMEAEAKIRRDFFLFVRTDSSAVVKKKFGVVGDAYFELTRGIGNPLPEKNASIVCGEQLPGALEAAIEEVRREAVPALKKLNEGLVVWSTLGSNLITSEERLDQVIIRASEIMTGLQQGKGTAGHLLTDPTAANELQSLLVKANQSAEELQATLRNLHLASGELQLATTNLPAISGVVANEARELPGLVLQTQVSMRELERLIEAMQRHWLVRKYVNRTNPPPVRPEVPAGLGRRNRRQKEIRQGDSARLNTQRGDLGQSNAQVPSPSGILRGVAYPVEAFDFKFVLCELLPSLLENNWNGFRQQPDSFEEVQNCPSDVFKHRHKTKSSPGFSARRPVLEGLRRRVQSRACPSPSGSSCWHSAGPFRVSRSHP